ncbi:MAG: alpha/beta hydrolase [Bacteroidales bacterium]|nr:alpha/beta hydrolase [Bacteroidales bacterium]
MKKTLAIIAALLLCGTSARLMAQAVNVQDVPGGVPERPAFDFPQPDIMFNLWPDGAPTDNGLTGEERDFGNHVSNVTKPTLAVFLPENPNGLALLVCPGGGYVDVWDKTEGYANSKWFTDQGIVYAVLKYRLPNGHPEVPQDDVHEAMRILKEHAEEYGFSRLGIAGCSAGGHLAATVSTHFTKPEERPDFTILFYPVVTMDPDFTHAGSSYYLLGREPSQELLDLYSNEKQVTADTPRAFIMANSDDRLVPCENSIGYYQALRANGVPAALHIYPVGGHGWADHKDFVYREAWMYDLRIWLFELAGELIEEEVEEGE